MVNLFKKELQKEYDSVGFKNQRQNLRELPQRGRTSKKIDEAREALRPGKRISKTGRVYWETRKNRSDAGNTNI